VWCKSEKEVEEIGSFKLGGKEIFSDFETESKLRGEEKKEREQKECTLRAERTIQVMVEERQHQKCSERGSRSILGSQRSYCHDKTNSTVIDSSEGVGRVY